MKVEYDAQSGPVDVLSARWDWLGSDIPSRDLCVLRHLLITRAAENPQKCFIRFETGETWTYKQALDHAKRAATGLAKLGVGPGDVVFVLLPNGPNFLKAWFGTNFLGAAVAAPNIAMRGATLQHLVTLSNAGVGVIDTKYLHRFEKLEMGKLKTLIVSEDPADASIKDIDHISVGTCFDSANPSDAPEVVVEPWQAQFILFTSGTTGPSKGAIVTYVQMYDMFLATSAGRLSSEDVYLASTPLFHVGGTRVVYGMLLLGGTVVLLSRFRTDTFWQTVQEYGATACVLIGATARFLENQAPRENDGHNCLRLVSMVPLVSDPQAFRRRFGVDLITSYGMSELSLPILSELNPVDPESCGRLRPGYDARIVDENDCEVPIGEAGELILRADRPWTISPGYWRMAEATASAWRNGWFHTGDRFRRNLDGDFFFVDRQKDTIRRRGENISSLEVEAEILTHPDVMDAAVIGVSSPHGEDDIMALIVLEPNVTPAPQALLEYLHGRMAPFMLPRYFRFTADLPRTVSMRVQKHLLRAEGITSDCWDREAVGIMIKRED
jgi:crotonobetaine/carnitine-CoA ligase